MTLGIVAAQTKIGSITSLRTFGGGSGNITFSSIPQNFDFLMLTGSHAFSTNISGNVESYPTIRFNNDSTASYSRIRMHSLNSVNSQSNVTGMDFATPGPSSTAWPRVAELRAYIFNYNNPSCNTTMMLSGLRMQGNTATGRAEEILQYLWMNTSAVTSINIISGHSAGSPSGTFQDWSYFSLYGVSR